MRRWAERRWRDRRRRGLGMWIRRVALTGLASIGAGALLWLVAAPLLLSDEDSEAGAKILGAGSIFLTVGVLLVLWSSVFWLRFGAQALGLWIGRRRAPVEPVQHDDARR